MKEKKSKERYISLVGGEPVYYQETAGEVIIALRDKNGIYTVIEPENNDAETKLLKWIDKYEKIKTDRFDGVETKINPFVELNTISESNCKITTDRQAAYYIYSRLEQANMVKIKGVNLSKPPYKSAEALKNWYFEFWEKEKDLYLENSIDKSAVELIYYEIEYANNTIYRFENKELQYFTDKDLGNSNSFKTIMAKSIYNKVDFKLEISNIKTFILWLKEHIVELNQSLIATNTPNGLEKIK